MTTFAFTVILDEDEVVTMQAALELMMKHCQEKLDAGEGAPYWAHNHSAKNIWKRLHDDKFQTSGNNFFKKDK